MADRVALVAGATGAVGQAVALSLAARGHSLVLSGRNAEALDHVASEARRRGARSVHTDAGTLADHRDAARVLAAAREPVDILVNASGAFGPVGAPEVIELDELFQTFGTNVLGPVALSLAVLPYMLARNWGRIINVSTAQTLHPPDSLVLGYYASKTTLNAATRCIAHRAIDTDVSACLIHPGDVRSAMWQEIRDSAKSAGASDLTAWADGVYATGGDPPEASGRLVDEIVEREATWSNGRFLAIPGGFDRHPAPW